jgi:hypothetical protein
VGNVGQRDVDGHPQSIDSVHRAPNAPNGRRQRLSGTIARQIIACPCSGLDPAFALW